MVPSDLIPSPVHHRHARREHRNQNRLGASPTGSPTAVFPSGRINARRLAANLVLLGTGPPKRPFPRPQRLRLSAPPSRGQSSRPAPSGPGLLSASPFGPSAPLPGLVRPSLGRFFASSPLPASRRPLPAFPESFTPLRGCYPPPDHRSISVRPVGPPPAPPDLPSLPAAFFFYEVRLRIIVSGPLLCQGLAVPQTSWNLVQYARETVSGQRFSGSVYHFSSEKFSFVPNGLQ